MDVMLLDYFVALLCSAVAQAELARPLPSGWFVARKDAHWTLSLASGKGAHHQDRKMYDSTWWRSCRTCAKSCCLVTLNPVENTRTSWPRLLIRLLAALPSRVPLHHVGGLYIKPASQLVMLPSIQSHQIQHTCSLKDTSIKPKLSFDHPYQIYQNPRHEGLYHRRRRRRRRPRGIRPSRSRWDQCSCRNGLSYVLWCRW